MKSEEKLAVREREAHRIAFASYEPKGGTEGWVMENFLP